LKEKLELPRMKQTLQMKKIYFYHNKMGKEEMPMAKKKLFINNWHLYKTLSKNKLS
jgi:hypothetical protein